MKTKLIILTVLAVIVVVAISPFGGSSDSWAEWAHEKAHEAPDACLAPAHMRVEGLVCP